MISLTCSILKIKVIKLETTIYSIEKQTNKNLVVYYEIDHS